jgi:uncharacterized cofD-like protein
MSVEVSAKQLRIVAIGGGTGLSTLLTGLKPYLKAGQRTGDLPKLFPEIPDNGNGHHDISLTAIVTVTDDGKSSGRLREEFGVIPPGDIRRCMTALAREDRFMTKLFRHRFTGKGEIGGHSLGNLILLAITQMSGSFLTAIDQASALLGCSAHVLPSTLESVNLSARLGKQTVRGQRTIKFYCETMSQPIRDLSLIPADAAALPEAVQAILEADLITLGPGSLFTSVIPNLLVSGIADALRQSKARKIYICNIMSEADETEGFTAEHHVSTLLQYGEGLKLDYALCNSTPISAEMRERYAEENAVALDPPVQEYMTQTRFVSLPLAAEEGFVRHDPVKLGRAIFEVYFQK